MTITEKTAYLKGLLEGMEIDQSTKEGKLLAAIIDTLDDIALSVADLDDEVGAINDEMDMMEESLDAIDEVLDDLEDALDAIDEDLDDMDEELEEIFEVLELEEDDDEDEYDDYEEDEDEELEDDTTSFTCWSINKTRASSLTFPSSPITSVKLTPFSVIYIGKLLYLSLINLHE